MNRLIKAEWYRLRNSSKFIMWTVLVCVALVAITFIDFNFEKGNVSDYLLNGFSTDSTAGIFFPFFFVILSSVILGIAYMNKTAYYEVMAGGKISHIILSKVFVDATFLTMVISLFLAVCIFIIGLVNGIGDMDKMWLRLILVVVVIYHVCTIGILITTSFRNIIGALVAFLRIDVVEGIAVSIITLLLDESPEEMLKISNWLVLFQIGNIINSEITSQLIITILASFILESVLWYVISYMGMKNKIYR